ncbi:periplasmic serine protease DO [Spirochaeta thermophila DSM 6192]|uniref:Periplasmic serine protease DO n=2 Tax=Winmispira thermophila TaxID=154 RepID=E0RSE8_WINT6|nr:periplasmic serine protease DO [Spirochaeta thermophila DSM 6192]
MRGYSRTMKGLFVFLMGFLGGMVFLLGFSCSTGASATPPPHTGAAIDLEALQNSFREVAEQALPIVTEISVVETKQQPSPEEGTPWFFFFFGEPEEGEPQPYESEALGSGVIVDRKGKTYYVLTNNHVIGKAEKITIRLYDDRTFPGTIVGRDERKDLALLSFEADSTDIPVAVLGDSSTLHVGDWVLAIGNPFGFDFSVTAGIVSALGRRGGPDGNISDFIQTDAAINKGNSGGALVNLKGEVVGINTWITSPTGGSIGLGFAIPINNVKKVIRDFIEKGKVEYGWLGVSVGDPADAVKEEMGLEGHRGAFVYQVFRGSPAYEGGILPGDYIVKVGDAPIRDADELVLRVGDLRPGEKVDFTLLRMGKEEVVEVRIGQRPAEEAIRTLNKHLWPGFSVYPLTDEVRRHLPEDTKDLEGLIVSSVEQGSVAAMAGLKAEDIVTAVGGSPVQSLKDFYVQLGRLKETGTLGLTVVREGQEIGFELTWGD